MYKASAAHGRFTKEMLMLYLIWKQTCHLASLLYKWAGFSVKLLINLYNQPNLCYLHYENKFNKYWYGKLDV